MNFFNFSGKIILVVVVVLTTVVAVCLLSQSPATPLFKAVTNDNLLLAKTIIASDPGQVQTRYRGRTCLHLAAAKKSADLLRWLVEVGSDIDAADGEGNTPLHLSVYTRQDSTLIWLLVLGADPNVRNRQGMTPLHVGAYMGMTKWTLKHLLQHGADPELTDASGRTFLDITRKTRPGLYQAYEQLRIEPGNQPSQLTPADR